jgi:hypothetical protein
VREREKRGDARLRLRLRLLLRSPVPAKRRQQRCAPQQGGDAVNRNRLTRKRARKREGRGRLHHRRLHWRASAGGGAKRKRPPQQRRGVSALGADGADDENKAFSAVSVLVITVPAPSDGAVAVYLGAATCAGASLPRLLR